MLIDDILPVLDLPVAAVKNQSIDKKQLIRRSRLSANSGRYDEEILDFRWLAAIDTPSTGVRPSVSFWHHCRSIGVFAIDVRPGSDLDLFAYVIHDTVRNPTLIFLASGGKIARVSAAQKQRIKGVQDDTIAVVFDGMATTCSIREAAVDSDFFRSLRWDQLPKPDLMEVFYGWNARVTALKAARVMGEFVLCPTIFQERHRDRTLRGLTRLTSHRKSLEHIRQFDCNPNNRETIAKQIAGISEGITSLRLSLRTMRNEPLNEEASTVLKAAGLLEKM